MRPRRDWPTRPWPNRSTASSGCPIMRRLRWIMMSPSEAAAQPSGRLQRWRTAWTIYGQPRVIGMGFLGFSSGLPYLLVDQTLSAWLKQAGVSLTVIGFASLLGVLYSIKFFWAPVIDRLPLPLLTRWLGKSRSWLLLAQLGLAVGLFGRAATAPGDAAQRT